MLSELYHVALNLKKLPSDFERERVHADFGKPGLGKVNFRLLLGEGGTLLRLDIPSSDDLVGLWRLQKGNFKFFPVISLPHPLLSIPAGSSIWTDLKKPTKERLRSLMDTSMQVLRPIDFTVERAQAERIKRWPHAESDVIQVLHRFSDSFLALASDPKRCATKLAEAWSRALDHSHDRDSLTDLRTFLCGVPTESKSKPPKVQLILDYVPSGEISGTLYRPNVKRVVLECLATEIRSPKRRNKTGSPDGVCALTGTVQPLLGDKFAAWSLRPFISKDFPPYSKFSNKGETRHIFRYHRADSDGFPIGATIANDLVEAGSTLTKTEWLNKTWRSLVNGKFKKGRNGTQVPTQDVLIAYPTFEWPALLSCVAIFGELRKDASGQRKSESSEDESDTAERVQAFAQVAEPFCKALTEGASPSELSSKYIRILILRQISDGVVQLAYSAQPTRQHFAAAVAEWMVSEKNLPPELRLPLPIKRTQSGFGSITPPLLFPQEAIRVFSYQWTRGGTKANRIQSPSVGEIFDLFLRREGVWEDTAHRLLTTLLPRVEPLLAGAGGLMRKLSIRAPSHWAEEEQARWRESFPKSANYVLLQAVSLIGTLLHALKSTKEKYMEQAPFRLGKLLAIMDQLHKCYCIDQRDGDLPPTLIGNGLLGRAGDSPQDALDELSDRSRIYLGWAKTAEIGARTSEERKIAINSARKLLRLAEPLAEALHGDAALRDPLSTQAKAHLFLGYLSPTLGQNKDAVPNGQQAPATTPTQEQNNEL